MAKWDNLHTRQEQARLHAAFDQGTLEGVEDGMVSNAYPLPACWYKPVYLLTARERGFVFGYWLQKWLERDEATQADGNASEIDTPKEPTS